MNTRDHLKQEQVQHRSLRLPDDHSCVISAVNIANPKIRNSYVEEEGETVFDSIEDT
jgi:hypothetical protein